MDSLYKPTSHTRPCLQRYIVVISTILFVSLIYSFFFFLRYIIIIYFFDISINCISLFLVVKNENMKACLSLSFFCVAKITYDIEARARHTHAFSLSPTKGTKFLEKKKTLALSSLISFFSLFFFQSNLIYLFQKIESRERENYSFIGTHTQTYIYFGGEK